MTAEPRQPATDTVGMPTDADRGRHRASDEAERRPAATLAPPARRAYAGPTRGFRLLTILIAVLAVTCGVLYAPGDYSTTVSVGFLLACYAVFLFAVVLPERPQRVVGGRLADVPDLFVGLPLLVLGPFVAIIACVALLAYRTSTRVGISRWSAAFNVVQAGLVTELAFLAIRALAPQAMNDLDVWGAATILLAALGREFLGESLATLGCHLDRIPYDFVLDDFARRTLSNVGAVVTAVAVVFLAQHGPLGSVLAVLVLLATLATGELVIRESNQRWLAEAVAVSGARIRAATTHEGVLDRLAEEVARLWHANLWELRPAGHRPEPARRKHVVLPLLQGREISLAHPALGVDRNQMERTTQTLVRMADERQRVLRFQQRLELQASRDDLTGLGNRRRLWDVLDGSLPDVSSASRLAAVYIDIARFKSVNDTYGHIIGDSLLRQVATRLDGFAGAIATAVRLSGDEFVLVMHHAPDDDALTVWAHTLLDQLSRPYELEGSVLNVGFSVGIAVADHPMDRSSLLAATDAAVARAKKSGRGSVVLATSEVVDESRRRLRLESELRTALAADEFELHYQPIVDTEAGRVTSVEALIRWYRNGTVVMRPDEFIQYAEEIGLISQIGLWVLRRACTQMKAWNELHRPYEPIAVSINVSTVHIAQPTFVEDVARVLEETGFPPQLLIIEITETFALLDLEKSIELGAELKAMGVALWLDDFGTGYSSLEYVRQLPVEVVKLDRSFIVDLGSDSTTRRFIESLVALCRSIDRQPMAEGVERPEQRAMLAELGCTIQQGYHFARPMPVEELADYVRRSDESVLPRRRV